MYVWLLGILVLILSFVAFLRRKLGYWQRRGIKTLEQWGLLGNLKQLNSMHHIDALQEIYHRYKATERLAGFYIYTKPVAVILDMDVMQSVLVKDFNKFANRGNYHNDKDLLASNLLFWRNEKWRPMRNKFSTIFTPSKIKYMSSTINATALKLKDALDGCLKSEDVLNMSDLSGRFVTDVIANCILGIESQSLKFLQNEFHDVAKQITGASGFNIRWKLFMETYVKLIQSTGVTVRVFPKSVEDFFRDVLKYNFLERERLNIRRNDLTDLLVDLRKNTDENGNPAISDQEIASSLFIFFAGGYETSTNTICNALMELARQPELQEKARWEIKSVLQEYNNEFCYEASVKMTYLEQIILEITRLYPIFAYLERTATEDYHLPNSDITLVKGTSVFLPLHSIHYDPEIYDCPEEFRPERFHPSEVAKRHPQSFLGFGDGPRNCIGVRLGRMQVVSALVMLLSNYKFSLCDKTVEKLTFSKHFFALRALEEVWLKVVKI